MINNHYTLAAIVAEIESEVESSLVAACLTRKENVLEIILTGGRAEPIDLVVSCNPRLNYIFLDPHPGKKVRGANVLPDTVGRKVGSMSVRPNDRSLRLALSGGLHLTMDLFGTHANILLEDDHDSIIASFLKRRTAEPAARVGRSGEHTPPDNARDFAERFETLTGTPQKRLSSIFPAFGQEVVKEILYRCGGEEKRPQEENGIYSLPDMYRIVKEVQLELASPSPRIYYENGSPVLMSLLEMRRLGSRETVPYDSVNSCVSYFVSEAGRISSTAGLKESLVSRLQKKKEELAETIRKIEKDLSVNRVEKYRTYGAIILQHLDEIEKGQESFRIQEADNSLVIPLDVKMSPIQNSQEYFDKSKKARESRRQALSRKEELAGLLKKVELDLRAAESETDVKALGSLEKKEKETSEPPTPYRHFEKDDFDIYVGKDASNNDSLTFGFAKPNDVFLHARGVSGSHVIIRNKSREYPPKPVIHYAASIAGWYSKARSSKLVPVAYTMKKFVKKAKGKPGAVFLDREEVVFVTPMIPQDSR